MSSFLLEESCYINTLFRDLFQRLRTVTRLTTSSDLARFDLPLRSLPPSFAPSARLFFFRSPSSIYALLSTSPHCPQSCRLLSLLPALSFSSFNLSTHSFLTLLPFYISRPSPPFLPLFAFSRYYPSLSISLPCTSTALPFFLPSFLLSHLLFAYFACNSHFKENEQGVY